jgi:aminobenzoyl-glutamate utilization protein A
VLAAYVSSVISQVEGVSKICLFKDFKACDDVTTMMESVQSRGGYATFLGLGSCLRDVHHSSLFDFDEAVLPLGVKLMVKVLLGTPVHFSSPQ